MTEGCIYTEEIGAEPCGRTPTVNLKHGLYDGPVCEEHEPRKCPECGGHRIDGECYCGVRKADE